MNTPKLPPLPKTEHAIKVKSAAGQEWQYPAYSESDMQANYLKGYNDARAAIEAQGVPDGWQLVPKKLTLGMLDAAAWGGIGYANLSGFRIAWDAALASAPPAPQATRCELCQYQHGHQIGCANNPVDIALKAQAQQWPFPGWEVQQAAVVQQEPVAYLDIGAVGYIDLGTDLSTEQLQALPAGRHMLGIIGTFGADGYVPAKQAKPQPLSDEQISHEAIHVQKFGHLGWEGFHAGVRFAEAYYSIKE